MATDPQELRRTARAALMQQIESLTMLASEVNDAYVLAVDMLRASQHVVATGLGKSGFIAQKFAATLASVCVPSRCLHPVDALHGDAGVINEGDVVVAFSKSGETPEILRFVDVARGLGARIIAITAKPSCRLAQLADVALTAPVTHEMDAHDILPTTSTTSALVMADLLAVGVLASDPEPLLRLRRSHPDGMIGGTLLRSVADVMHTGSQMPCVHPDASMVDALAEMSAKALGIVCVCENGHLQGVVTDGDVRRMVAGTVDLRSAIVRDVMTATPVTIGPHASLHEALQRMEHRERQIAVLPVVDDGRCVGVVRLHDIVRLQV